MTYAVALKSRNDGTHTVWTAGDASAGSERGLEEKLRATSVRSDTGGRSVKSLFDMSSIMSFGSGSIVGSERSLLCVRRSDCSLCMRQNEVTGSERSSFALSERCSKSVNNEIAVGTEAM